MSYKVVVWDTDDGEGASNALRFATEDEAKAYGKDLFWRWTALKWYEVQTSDEPVNYTFDATGLRSVLE